MNTITLGLHTRNLSTKFRAAINPFTGKAVRFPLDDGLTEAERANVQAVLKTARASKADPDGYRKISCKDGGKLNIRCGKLEAGPVVSMALEIDLSEEIISILFDLAAAGNMAIGSSIEPAVAALTSKPQNKLVAKRWPKAQITASPDQLGQWLKKSIQEGVIV